MMKTSLLPHCIRNSMRMECIHTLSEEHAPSGLRQTEEHLPREGSSEFGVLLPVAGVAAVEIIRVVKHRETNG